MNDQRRTPPDKGNSLEPEIIPPDQPDAAELDTAHWPRRFVDVGGEQRIYVTRIGPLGLLPFALLFGFVSVALLIFFIGAFLILIPVLGFVVAATIIAGLLRINSHRPR